MSYRLKPHTADIAVEATGDSIEAVFAAVADGLAAACIDTTDLPPTGERFVIQVDAEGRDAALYDYLDELIFQRDVKHVLPVDNEVTIHHRDGRWVIDGSARGVPAEGLGGREVKAVTYSDMVLEQRREGWFAYVVFDV